MTMPNQQASALAESLAAGVPELTEDLDQAKQDLDEYGFCLVANALTGEALATTRQRLVEQAEGEAERASIIGTAARIKPSWTNPGASKPTHSPPPTAASTNACGCWSTRAPASGT